MKPIQSRCRLGLLLTALLLLVLPAAAQAAVTISFYSKEFGASFPHAFVALEGTLDRSGERVTANYGFTAKTVSPAILMGAVTGMMHSVDASYIKASDLHFSFRLSDEEYDRVMRAVGEWRTHKQPSYNLNKRNCVFFVGDVAARLGMKAETPARLMKKPRSYLEMLTAANRDWLAARDAETPRLKSVPADAARLTPQPNR